MKLRILLTGLAACAILTQSCADKEATAVKPQGEKPSWGPTIGPEMQTVIEKLESFGDTPIPQLTPVEARKNHTAADAVMGVMADKGIPAPDYKLDTAGIEIPVTNGTVHARVYRIKGSPGYLPVIVYYHGGGFVIANIDVYDASARLLAANTGAVVVSVAYRLAPENKFPTAHNDAFDAYTWVTKNAQSINGDASKVALAGESAGGNLAVATAIKARDNGVKAPVHILSIYPIAAADTNSVSYVKYAYAKPLDKASLKWFTGYYTNNPSEAMDPRLNLVTANLRGLPPVTIINAEIDPLETEGGQLAQKLQAAGVPVERRVYTGVTHEFFSMGTVVPHAKEAENYAVSRLKQFFK